MRCGDNKLYKNYIHLHCDIVYMGLCKKTLSKGKGWFFFLRDLLDYILTKVKAKKVGRDKFRQIQTFFMKYLTVCLLLPGQSYRKEGSSK